jgi:hypothetical protein
MKALEKHLSQWERETGQQPMILTGEEDESMPSTVTTSATTDLLKTTTPQTDNAEIVYQRADAETTYAVEPHPPTPRWRS